MNRQVVPPSSISSSTGSRVVPATESTTARCSPTSLLSREDLPTLGLPISATRRGPVSPIRSLGASGRASRARSSMSPLPRPCMAETMTGSPRPSDHSDSASASLLASSTLLATSTTGLPARRSTFATASPSSVAPTRAATTNRTAPGRSTAPRASSATWAARPCARSSQPPVSTSVNDRPRQFASYVTRALVTPGTSCTTACRAPRMRLTRVDLPTLGRPTTARIGCPVGPPARAPPASSKPESSKSASLTSPISIQPASPLMSGDSTLIRPASVRYKALIPRAGELAALPGQPGDLLDYLGQGQLGRVEQHRVGGHLRLRGVQPVPPGLGGLGRVHRCALLGGAPPGARLRVCGQEHLELGVRGDDGADVAPLGDDADGRRGDDRALRGDEVVAHRLNPRDHADLGGGRLGADFAGNVVAVDAGPRVVRVGPDLDRRLRRPG